MNMDDLKDVYNWLVKQKVNAEASERAAVRRGNVKAVAGCTIKIKRLAIAAKCVSWAMDGAGGDTDETD